jgi:hypothetical protein
MHKIIPNNSICIFKTYFAASRNGKILRIENIASFDPDFNSAFSVKLVQVKKLFQKKAIHLRKFY